MNSRTLHLYGELLRAVNEEYGDAPLYIVEAVDVHEIRDALIALGSVNASPGSLTVRLRAARDLASALGYDVIYNPPRLKWGVGTWTVREL